MSLKKWPFWKADFYLANQSNLKSSDWLEKSQPSKNATLVFDMYEQTFYGLLISTLNQSLNFNPNNFTYTSCAAP